MKGEPGRAIAQARKASPQKPQMTAGGDRVCAAGMPQKSAHARMLFCLTGPQTSWPLLRAQGVTIGALGLCFGMLARDYGPKRKFFFRQTLA